MNKSKQNIMPFFNMISDAWKTEYSTTIKFEAVIRRQIRDAHVRYNQNIFRQKNKEQH